MHKKVIVFLPAYKSERTLEKTIRAIPAGVAHEILVTDDASPDRSGDIARAMGLPVIVHETNRGYGGAQKTAYKEALRRGADIVVMLHADFQYDPGRIPALIEPLRRGEADAAFGSRMHSWCSARKGGMALWRFIPNIALTFLQERVFHLGLSEYHTGYRAYTKELLEAIPFEKNSDNYVFDSEMLAEIALGRYRAAEIPIETRYTEESHSPNFRKSVEYGLMTLAVVGKYLLHRFRLKRYPQFEVRPRA